VMKSRRRIWIAMCPSRGRSCPCNGGTISRFERAVCDYFTLGSAPGADCKGAIKVTRWPSGRPTRANPMPLRHWCRFRRMVRFLGGRSIETSLKYADERDLIETFVERSRWHCRAARETFSTDEFRPVTTVLASTTLALRHECC